jgi:ADP-ribose pyrophosphatase
METVFSSRKFEIARQTVTGSDGREHVRDFVMHPGAVVTLALAEDDHCLMVRQIRPAVGREFLELPAGTLDVPGEPPQDAAGRELEEETGHRAAKMEWLCDFYPSPGITSERISAYVATGLTRTRQRLGPTEQLTAEKMPIGDVLRMIADGEIQDAKTIITMLRWAATRGLAV